MGIRKTTALENSLVVLILLYATASFLFSSSNKTSQRIHDRAIYAKGYHDGLVQLAYNVNIYDKKFGTNSFGVVLTSMLQKNDTVMSALPVDWSEIQELDGTTE